MEVLAFTADIDSVLVKIAMALDIPPHKFQEAKERFDSISRHLQEGKFPNSLLRNPSFTR